MNHISKMMNLNFERCLLFFVFEARTVPISLSSIMFVVQVYVVIVSVFQLSVVIVHTITINVVYH